MDSYNINNIMNNNSFIPNKEKEALGYLDRASNSPHIILNKDGELELEKDLLNNKWISYMIPQKSYNKLKFTNNFNKYRTISIPQPSNPDFPGHYGVPVGHWLPYNTSTGRGKGPEIVSNDMHKVSFDASSSYPIKPVAKPTLTEKLQSVSKSLLSGLYKISPFAFTDNTAKEHGKLNAVTSGALGFALAGVLGGLLKNIYKNYTNPYYEGTILGDIAKTSLLTGLFGGLYGYYSGKKQEDTKKSLNKITPYNKVQFENP